MTESVDAIEERFLANLTRVTKLVTLFRELAGGRGRAPVAETDVLRAAVVLLHAALEDLLTIDRGGPLTHVAAGDLRWLETCVAVRAALTEGEVHAQGTAGVQDKDHR